MAMGSTTTLLRFPSCYCSSTSLRSLDSPAHAENRASCDNRWIGNCNRGVGFNQFNPLTSFPANRRSLHLSQAQGHSPPMPLRVSALFGWKKKPAVIVRETVIPEPDYRIPIVLLGATGVFISTDNLLAAAPTGLLGLLLLFQHTDKEEKMLSEEMLETTRVKFVFSDDALEVKIGDELQESGENVFVGGKNSWKYSTFTNWEFWWPNFPILVYFKETQTKPEGQIHFFPIIFNGKQVYDLLVERAGPSKTSGPK